MIELANSTSLLEVGFAVNAVYAIVFSKYRDHRNNLYEFVIGSVSKYKSVDHISRKHVQKFIYGSTNIFKILKYGLFICLFLSIGSIIWSLGWLIQSSFTQNAEVSNWIFIIYIILCIIINPFLFLCFYEGSRFISEYFVQNVKVDEHDAELISSVSESMEEFDKMIKEFDKEILDFNTLRLKQKARRLVEKIKKYF